MGWTLGPQKRQQMDDKTNRMATKDRKKKKRQAEKKVERRPDSFPGYYIDKTSSRQNNLEGT